MGKSTLVRLFAEEEGMDLIEVNLEKTKLGEVENDTHFSVRRLLDEIEIATGKRFSDNSLLFLDEIQSQPMAINRLRYLYEDTDGLKVIAAGSLLDVVLHEERFSMPVGRVESYVLGPFTFKEFLHATGEHMLVEQIEQITPERPPSSTLHYKALDRLKEFFFIGGMPEAVKVFVEERSLENVRKVHQSLLDTYESDIPKYTKGKKENRVRDVYQYVLRHAGEVKVKFSSVSSTNSNEIKNAIDVLSRAYVIRKVIHTHAAGVPLSAGENASVLKLFFLDVGLLNAFLGVSWGHIFKSEPESFLLRGVIAEQFAAQHLQQSVAQYQYDLHYWLREGRSTAAEVDFLTSLDNEIVPIEIKSGKSGKLNSLWQFIEERSPKLAVRFDLTKRVELLSHERRKADAGRILQVNLLSLPLYAIEELTSILKRQITMTSDMK